MKLTVDRSIDGIDSGQWVNREQTLKQWMDYTPYCVNRHEHKECNNTIPYQHHYTNTQPPAQ